MRDRFGCLLNSQWALNRPPSCLEWHLIVLSCLLMQRSEKIVGLPGHPWGPNVQQVQNETHDRRDKGHHRGETEHHHADRQQAAQPPEKHESCKIATVRDTIGNSVVDEDIEPLAKNEKRHPQNGADDQGGHLQAVATDMAAVKRTAIASSTTVTVRISMAIGSVTILSEAH